MAGVLIAMRVAVLRHSMRGPRAWWSVTGAVVGLVLALGTIWAGAGGIGPAAGTGTLLAMLWGLWALGWAIAPLISGGGEPLKPENFAALPVPPGRLARGLLAASFVGFGAAVTLVALLSLVAYAVVTGPLTLVVAVPGVALQLGFVVMLARLVNAVAGVLLRTHAGAALVAIVWAGSMALLAQGWALIAALAIAWGPAGPELLDDIVGLLPSGWPVRAVEAAGRGEWLLAVGYLAGTAVLIAAMLLVWSRMLQRRLTSRATAPRPRRASAPGLGRLASAGPVGAVAAKELRAWSRDLLRVNHLWFAITYGVVFCLLPLMIGWWGMAPYTGLAILLMSSGMAANIFGSDGTALWLTLLTPGAARADVRGRQLAWLLVLTPIVLAFTVGLTIPSGQGFAWPIVLALVPAMLGGAAGLASVVSVYMLVPLTDPHKRGANPLGVGDNEGSVAGLTYVMLLGVPVTAVPAGAIVAVGLVAQQPWLSWLGVPVGLLTGALCAWAFGRMAHRRLDAYGPELLQTMRTGVAVTSREVTGTDGVKRLRADVKTGQDLPKWKSVTVAVCYSTGWLPLFPQGLVALGFALFGAERKSWFLATYLGPWAVPFAVLMVVLGLSIYGVGLYLPWDERRKKRAAEETEAAETPTGVEAGV
ncbi:hypothetical protein AB0I28_04085 [Phytomonospora sp. NPDC050363]|uniref:hypothetical protein n=1 Tax=Phytomonospora sp. NPDC050363 TaxID=3155642 RepID=UPI003408FFD9